MSYTQKTSLDIAEGLSSLNADLSSSVLPRWQRKALAQSRNSGAAGGGGGGRSPGKSPGRRGAAGGKTPGKSPAVRVRAG